MFLPLANGEKLLLVIRLTCSVESGFPGACRQKETTTLKHCLGLQMFLIWNFPLTTRVLHYLFLIKEHVNEYTGLTMSE